jgi:site-specific recombinase XerD
MPGKSVITSHGRPGFDYSATDWLAVSKTDNGPVFRTINRHGWIFDKQLSAKAVALVVKRLTAGQGIEGDFAGHSLRAGLATAAASAGVPERAIMVQTGRKSLATMRKYIREGSLFLENAAGRVGL